METDTADQPINASLTVNDRRHSVTADADMPLLWVLRDLLNLTGTKYGCGRGLCGACTVHLDGRAARSCQLPLGAIPPGSSITTIEGLCSDGMHPAQRAWVDNDVPQCGFCQPGQIMQAASLVDEPGNHSRKTFIKNQSNNLCRCGTHARIVKAVTQLAAASSRSGDRDGS